MGYPMTYRRVLSRNRLFGFYSHGTDCPDEMVWGDRREPWQAVRAHPFFDASPLNYTEEERADPRLSAIRGDLRRLEHDQRDAYHLSEYARRTGLTADQCRAVLDLFFEEGF